MEGEEFALAAMALVTCLQANCHIQQRNNPVKKRRRHWVRPWMARKSKNVFSNLLKEICLEDTHSFQSFHRKSKENFVKLLRIVSPLIKKDDTKLRKAISPAQRLSVTLRYLATGNMI